MSRFLRPVRTLWPVLVAALLGVVASASLATIRIKAEGGETVEAMAERLYGDARKAAVIRAANKINDGEQPADGAFLKIPGTTIHTVADGETMQKVADRFFSGDGGAALLAEANGLAATAKLKPGQVLSVFAEIEVRTNGRKAEEIADLYLGDANLGARIRRYNGVADGGKLGGKTYVPLVGLEPRGGATPPPVAVVTPPVAVVTPPVAVVTPPLAVATPPVAVVAPPVGETPPAVAVATATAGDAAKGAVYWQAKCNKCHPGGNKGVGPALAGKSLPGPLKPAVGGRHDVAPDQFENVLAYLVTLGAVRAAVVATAPVATPPVAVVTPPVAVVTPPVAVVTPPPIMGTPPTVMPGAEGMPVTSKLATLTGFSHGLHAPLTVAGKPVGCLTCHEHSDPNGFATKPPSQANCLLCHRQAEVMPPALRKGQLKRLPFKMNHKLHVGENQIDCTICHMQEPDRPLGIATQGHEACSACHTQGSIPPYVAGDPSGLSCTVCHSGSVEEEPLSPERSRYLRNHLIRPFGRVGDVFFTHMTHATFGAGGVPGGPGPSIDCRACHADAYEAETKEAISKVKMQGCMECHRQANAVGLQPPERCVDCHLQQRQGHMPQNELIVTAKPIDHTAFFRRHHATAAQENAPMCASCHKGADPNDGNRCDTCHATMKPRDHTAGFRDRVHGRTAQVDPARCTTCHRAERCESCHREIPKSHFPLNVWVEKGLHSSRGRLELGACLTCHKFEQTCSRCHTAVQK